MRMIIEPLTIRKKLSILPSIYPMSSPVWSGSELLLGMAVPVSVISCQ